MTAPPIVLASASPYRRQLLARLGLRFTAVAPRIDETSRPREMPAVLVRRLACAKAAALADAYPDAVIVGADQIAVRDGVILGKPGSHEKAVAQLLRARGQRVEFHTGISLLNAASGRMQQDSVACAVTFRALSAAQIENYVRCERPYDCAGGFKAEGLGIALFAKIEGGDPTALIGLPLLRVVAMLAREGIDVPPREGPLSPS